MKKKTRRGRIAALVASVGLLAAVSTGSVATAEDIDICNSPDCYWLFGLKLCPGPRGLQICDYDPTQI